MADYGVSVGRHLEKVIKGLESSRVMNRLNNRTRVPSSAGSTTSAQRQCTNLQTASLKSDDKFGFIVMNGDGALFATLSGNTRELLHKFTVQLPKKHQSAASPRFARIRSEKRQHYVMKTAELAGQFFIDPKTKQPNVTGLILAGCSDFKTELSRSETFHLCLRAKILKVVDVAYGGENGFKQAIDLSADVLANVKFLQEVRVLRRYFEDMSRGTGKYAIGIEDTVKALEMGAVETLIVWEDLDVKRCVLANASTGEIVIEHRTREQEQLKHPGFGNAALKLKKKIPLLEWFAKEYKRFGCMCEFVTNKSDEGQQFCRGLGGVGAILKYQVDMTTYQEDSDLD